MTKRVYLNRSGSSEPRFGQSIAAIQDPRGLTLVVSALGRVSVFTFDPTLGLAASRSFTELSPARGQSGASSTVSPAAASRFGWRLRNIGDTDGDGTPDLAITAPHRDGTTASAWFAGAVYVLSGGDLAAGGAGSFRLFSPNGANDRLGYGHDSVTGIPDINGDGLADMLVGAMNGGASGGGAAYVLSH